MLKIVGYTWIYILFFSVLKWSVAGSEIINMLQTENDVEKECNHHEDNDHFEEEVKKDSENFYGSMKEFENQFIEFEEGIMFIETRQVLLTETNNSVTVA